MFKFTIRDMIWLTIVVALSLGWWMHQKHLREKSEFYVAITDALNQNFGPDHRLYEIGTGIYRIESTSERTWILSSEDVVIVAD